jgi:hypothetical protein
LVVTGSGGVSSCADCQGSDTTLASGCVTAGGAKITVTGNLINGPSSTFGYGKIVWEPASAQNYIKFNGGGTVIYASAGLGSDAGGTQITGANTAAKVASGTYFVKKDDGVYTQGSKAGGGAWGF